MIKKIKLYYHTLKFLKPIQIIGRLKLLFPDFIFESNCEIITNKPPSNFYYVKKNNSTKDYNSFTFLNKTYEIKQIGWNSNKISKLWVYNLNYFNFLLDKSKNNKNKIQQFNLINHWIHENKFKKTQGWEPYPTSLRIINWIKWDWQNNLLNKQQKKSLWNQVRYLNNNLEFHLLGNHLFLNCKAILFACAYFNSDSIERIYKKVLKIFNKEIDTQFLADGAHFELSPMYHCSLLEDLLDLYMISEKLPKNFPRNKIKIKIKKAFNWINYMVHPNGELSNFNDSCNNSSPSLNDLTNMAELLSIDISISKFKYKHLLESGYFVVRNKNIHLIADVGKIGPDYLPGHSHADTLSFEISINGKRLVVNSGIDRYGNSKERLNQRRTKSHSTISFDDYDSSEVWSSFRVARRANPFNFKKNIVKDVLSFSCSHDGFHRLKGKPTHNREWLYNGNEIIVKDKLMGKFGYANSRFFFHPHINLVKKRNVIFAYYKNNLLSRIFIDEGCFEYKLSNSKYFPEFGYSINNKFIDIKYSKEGTYEVRFIIN